MFRLRNLFKKDLKKVPYAKKIRVLYVVIENVLRKNTTGLQIPLFQRVNTVLGYMIANRRVDYYFTNRSLIPALCDDLKCFS